MLKFFLCVVALLCWIVVPSFAAGKASLESLEKQIPSEYLKLANDYIANQKAMNEAIAAVRDLETVSQAGTKIGELVADLKKLANQSKKVEKLEGRLQLAYVESIERQLAKSSKRASENMKALQKNEAVFRAFLEKVYFAHILSVNAESEVLNEFLSTDEVLVLVDGKEVDYESGPAQLKVKDSVAAIRHKDWKSYSAIALGDGHSVVFQTKSANPMLAEYFQRVFLFKGDRRRGEFSGGLQLQMNTGGRTHVLVSRGLDKKGTVVQLILEDRFGKNIVDLQKADFLEDESTAAAKVEYLGLLSGSAYPNKFITPLVMSEVDARKEL